MVGTGPHIGEVQRPEMDDRQPVRVDRALGLLRNEVVHHAEEAGGQEEADRVMAVPPLHHRVLHAGIGGIRLPQRRRQLDVVDDMQDRDRQDVGAEKPVGHVDVAGLAAGDGAEEHGRVSDPYRRDQQVDRPFQLGVFLRGRDAQRQRDRRGDDHRLPAPEGERRQRPGEQARLAGPLHHVVRRREQRAAAEGEDHRIGMQRTQPSERQPRRIEIEFRPDQLRGKQHADRHADDAPYHGHDGELPHDVIVEGVGGARGRGRAGQAGGGDIHSDPQGWIWIRNRWGQCRGGRTARP